MAGLWEQIGLVAPTSAPVLVTGESGSGKELVASLIHRGSERCDRPLIPVNCSAIPAELLEVELFGQEEGGGQEPHKGRLDLADGGSLFLDEVGDMPQAVQARVLRLLQEGVYERAGGSRPLVADIRIIAATSRPLYELVQGGEFREDLFSRLNVVPLTVPPLRERENDIPLLVEHFLEVFCSREGYAPKRVMPEAMELLKRYEWPGNVRELKNIMERLVIMTPGAVITTAHIPESIASAESARDTGGETRNGALFGHASLREAREEFEREFILQKLEENDWNISRTAEAIELERSNLHRKIKSYGIDLKK
jgi:two-component system nitrogen regulation response regulator NtrX